MAAGHVSSLTNFLLMKTVTQIHFDPAGGVSAEANNEAVAAMAGIQVCLVSVRVLVVCCKCVLYVCYKCVFMV